MLYRKHCFLNKMAVLLLSLTVTTMLAACGQNTEKEADSLKQEAVIFEDIPEEYRQDNQGLQTTPTDTSIPASATDTAKKSDSANVGSVQSDTTKAEELKKLFGENCITEQTFEVELSEYNGKVYFVALAPSADNPDFSMKIVQNGETLTTLRPYTPEKLSNTVFTSLDAVSFYDVNYDSYPTL